jgi:diguanylate cyclase (GGDEF)-like protein/PAS domain S-box-containing protein
MQSFKYLHNNKTLIYPLLTLIVCLLITYIAFSKAKTEVDADRQVYFDFRVREAINLIENRMQTYEQVLLGTAGLFKSSKKVERNEFKEYVETLNLAKNYPGIQGVGFSLIIYPEDKNQHTKAIRSEGFPSYTIWPDGSRDIYTSIIYLEPFSDRNLRAFGYDMFSESVRHEAMQKAIDTGKTHLSGKIKLVQETGEKDQAGFLMYLPVYENSPNIETQMERRDKIIGWVYSPFRMNDLMEGLFGEYAEDLDIHIYDGEAQTDKSLMYDSDGSYIIPNEQSKTINLEIANHPWTVQIHPLPSMNLRVDNTNPHLILAIGAIISVLLSLLIWFLVTGRERAINIATQMNADLMYQAQRLTNILEGTRAGTWEWNILTGETHFNENWAKMIGYELKELEPISINTWLKFVHPEDAQISETLLAKHFSGESAYYEFEARMKHKDGHWVWVLDRGKVTSWSPDGMPLLMSGTHQDINERKQLEFELKRQAHLDPLTGLSNRRHFLVQGDVELSRAIRSNSKLSVLMLDIDFFKKVNDSYGHQAGDSILQALAKVCQDTIRKINVIARLGGEEFAIILPGTNAYDAILVAERLREFVANMEVTIPPNLSIKVTISIGISTLDNNFTNIDTLLNQADKALYEAKKTGRNKVCIHQTDLAVITI